jgi:hypothetical protein
MKNNIESRLFFNLLPNFKIERKYNLRISGLIWYYFNNKIYSNSFKFQLWAWLMSLNKEYLKIII